MPFSPELILMIPVFLLSLTVHEAAHALTAKWGGDMTASYQGRLTLNPIAHIDPIGTIVIPIIAAISHVPLFGWAKPVPVAEENFRKRNWGVVVALAGPGSNFLLILLTALTLKVLITLGVQMPDSVGLLAGLMIQINLILMLFNLIPIPPLDGSHLLWHLVIKGRGHLYPAFFTLAQFGMFVLLGLFIFPPTANLFGSIIRGLFYLVIRFIEL